MANRPRERQAVPFAAPGATGAMPIAAQAAGFVGRAVYADRNVDAEFGDGCQDAPEDPDDALQAEVGSRDPHIYSSRALLCTECTGFGASARLQERPCQPLKGTPAWPGGAEHGK